MQQLSLIYIACLKHLQTVQTKNDEVRAWCPKLGHTTIITAIISLSWCCVSRLHLSRPLDQINIAVFSGSLLNLSCSVYHIRYCCGVHWTSHFLHSTRNTQPCKTGQPVFSDGKWALRRKHFLFKISKLTVHSQLLHVIVHLQKFIFCI